MSTGDAGDAVDPDIPGEVTGDQPLAGLQHDHQPAST